MHRQSSMRQLVSRNRQPAPAGRDAYRTGAQSPEPATNRSVRIPASHLSERFHDEQHEAVWQICGRSRFLVEDRIIELVENDVLWIPAGMTHSAQLHPDSVVFHYLFSLADTATLLDDVSLAHLRPDEIIYFLALKQMTTTEIRSNLNLARQVLSILEQRILRGDDLPLPHSPAATTVAEGLLSNPGDDRTVAEWAEEAHTSARSLERAFLRETGLTLRQWRLHNRMKAASSLLDAGASVTSVSHRVGYMSPNSFTRAFREHFGTTPSRHRSSTPRPQLHPTSADATI